MTPLILAALFTCTQPAVTDGDTIRCDAGQGQRVRIWGIDTKDPPIPEQTEAMRAIINGMSLTCETRGKSYNRTVALCRLPNGTDIGGEMIRQGRAVEWVKFSKGYYRGIGR
jgi:endonuclease YncB( thermonuclease family)